MFGIRVMSSFWMKPYSFIAGMYSIVGEAMS